MIFYVCVYGLRTSYTLNFCLFSSHSKVTFDCLLAQLSPAPPESLQEAYYRVLQPVFKTVALSSWNTLPEYYIMKTLAVVVLQLLSHILLFMTPWTAAHQASMSFNIPRVCSNSCPLSWWCHPTISSSFVSFSCPQFFPASGSFPTSCLFTSGGQCIGASASASALLIIFRIDFL